MPDILLLSEILDGPHTRRIGEEKKFCVVKKMCFFSKWRILALILLPATPSPPLHPAFKVTNAQSDAGSNSGGKGIEKKSFPPRRFCAPGKLWAAVMVFFQRRYIQTTHFWGERERWQSKTDLSYGREKMTSSFPISHKCSKNQEDMGRAGFRLQQKSIFSSPQKALWETREK